MKETNYTETLYYAIRKLSLDKEEKIQLLVCLYINGCSSEDCVKLFGSTEEKVIRILESEDVHGYKACTKCGKLKDREEDFRQRNNRKITICRMCEREYDKEYGKRNVERTKERDKEYRKNNKEYKQAYMKEYFKNNKERKKEYDKEHHKEYYENNKDEILKNRKEYRHSGASIESVQKLDTFEEVSGNQIRCKYCGKWMTPTVAQVNNRLQGIENDDTLHIYCSEECKEECPIYRQRKYPKGFKPASSREVDPVLRQLVLARDEFVCQKCHMSQEELDVGLHCHHITPVVNSPIEANDVDNCITFCKDCHEEVHQMPGCGYGELRCE